MAEGAVFAGAVEGAGFGVLTATELFDADPVAAFADFGALTVVTGLLGDEGAVALTGFAAEPLVLEAPLGFTGVASFFFGRSFSTTLATTFFNKEAFFFGGGANLPFPFFPIEAVLPTGLGAGLSTFLGAIFFGWLFFVGFAAGLLFAILEAAVFFTTDLLAPDPLDFFAEVVFALFFAALFFPFAPLVAGLLVAGFALAAFFAAGAAFFVDAFDFAFFAMMRLNTFQ